MKTIETLQRDLTLTADMQAIVRTMKVLAAVSIRQYESAQESLQHYQKTVELGLQAVMLYDRPINFQQSAHKTTEVAAIVFGSDHGLCGRYNESLAQFIFHEFLSKQRQQDCRILVIGSRLEAALAEVGQKVENCLPVAGTASAITVTVQKILQHIDLWQQQGIERITLFHHAKQKRSDYPPVYKKLLPLDLSNLEKMQRWPSRSLPQFSLPKLELMRSLVKQYLFCRLYNACAESLAGEHANRLVSMQVAEKNIQKKLESLTTNYRQLRQDLITSELLDVVSGYELLKEDMQ